MDSTGASGLSSRALPVLRLQGAGLFAGLASRMIVRERAPLPGAGSDRRRELSSVENLARGLVELRGLVDELMQGARVARVGKLGKGGGQAFASTGPGASLGLDLTPTSTKLRSTAEINTKPNSFQLASPFQDPLTTSSPSLGGLYDGSLGTDTLRFEVKDDAVVGVAPFDVDVKDSSGGLIETLTFGADPPGTIQTLASGIELSFSSGFLKNGDAFTVDVSSGTVNPANPFEGTGAKDPNFEPGQSVGDGSFFVNGTEIAVRKEDSINDVLAKINASSAGVSAVFDAVAEEVVLTRTTPGSSQIVLGADDSGFLDAVKLTGAVQELGLDEGDADRAVSQVAALGGIGSGTFSINGVGFTVDTATQSLNGILDAINASAVNVTADFDSVTQRVVLTSHGSGKSLVLDDGTSGFFTALGLDHGTIAPASAATFGSSLGLDVDGQPFTTLGSTEELNTTPYFSGPYSVAFSGASTTAPTVGGVYNGDQGDDTLTFLVRETREVGSEKVEIKVRDSAGNDIETVTFEATDPPDTVKTLSNGLTLSLSAGTAVKDDTFQIQVASGVVDPDGRFDKGGAGANLEAGFPIVDGDAYINGTKIGIKHDDTINDVLNKINGSNAGVIASFDAVTERFLLTQSSAGPQNEIVLGSDDSGFFAAFKLTDAVQVLAEQSDVEATLSQVTELAAIASGTFSVNGTQLTVDTQSDSLEDVLARINASGAGVTATFDASDDRVVLVSNDPATSLVLDDETSGLFAALGIADGTIEPSQGGGKTTRSVSRFARPREVRQQLQDLESSFSGFFDAPGSSAVGLSSKGAQLLGDALEAAFEDLGLERSGDYLRSSFGIDISLRDPERIALEVDLSELRRAMSRDPDGLLRFLVGDEGSAKPGGLLNALDTALSTFSQDVLAKLDPTESKGLILDLQA